MGLFHNKPDPISDRAKTLKSEIARIETEIQGLSQSLAQAKNQPRLRSTAQPHSNAPKSPTPEAREPIFEEADPKPLTQPPPAPPARGLSNDLRDRQSKLASVWKRIIKVFRPPAPSNPKLLNLLAAGNIQGLRPLRYEKRVARNRFIALVVIFLLVLWGILAFFFRHR
jgi:hypothetical protein